jgi:hypothetical protein
LPLQDIYEADTDAGPEAAIRQSQPWSESALALVSVQRDRQRTGLGPSLELGYPSVLARLLAMDCVL